MTFNPGRTKDKETMTDFHDVREIPRTLTTSADETTTGPAHFIIADPDGNTIMLDQHVPSPKR